MINQNLLNAQTSLKKSPFFERTSLLNQSQAWRRWGWYLSAVQYDMTHDNEYFATGGMDGLIYLWETSRWGNPYQLKHHKTKITDVTFSNNDSHFFSTDNRGNTLIWNYQYQQPLIEKNIFNGGIENNR